MSESVVEQVDSSMTSTYEDLATELLSKYFTSTGEDEPKQTWICIAGGPGSGKSTLSAALVGLMNERCNQEISVVLPMDGYHYSRAQLQTIADNSNGDTTFEDLLARRGAPWTFDPSSLIADLTLAKANKCGALPTYSRVKSDPVPGGVELQPHHQIVLVEGNYLLNHDDESWRPLEALFEERWFIRCESLEKQRQRLIRRHLETWSTEKTRMFGPGEEGAARKADGNDVLNMQYVEEHRKYATREILSKSR